MSVAGVYTPRAVESRKDDAYTNPAFEEGTDAEDPNKSNGVVNKEAVEVGEATQDVDPEVTSSLQERVWETIDAVKVPTWEAIKEQKREVCITIGVFLVAVYCVGLVWASVRSLSDATPMLILTALVILALAYRLVRDHYGGVVTEKVIRPLGEAIERLGPVFTWSVASILLVVAVIVVIVLCRKNPRQLTSAVGLVVFILFTYVTSKNPRKVRWRPVLWGLALQFIFALVILRTQIGFDAFNWLGLVVQSFLGFSDAGAQFLFGETGYLDHFFAFKVLPVVIYFSCCISVLYHWGVMQVVIKKVAWLMQTTMKTSASESLNAAGNIFIGQAPLLIRPMLKDMTKSELHAVMTGGFATIAGGVLGAYIAFGISASHLLSASVMSAPAALAVAKLFYPETEKSKHVKVEDIELSEGDFRNVIEAASHGAFTAVPLALNIAGNLIAFIAILALLNGIFGYLGGLLGWDFLSFEWICSYVLIPIPLVMGVEPRDCRLVAELIGLKTFLNEFVAYERLSELIQNRLNGGEDEYMSVRSEIIATYALCGFSNIGSIGIQLGGMTPLAPSRASDFASVAVRALIAGTIACFMTACIAGVLYDESKYEALALGAVNQTAGY